MPTTLTETATFGASVAVPATGEARTAASVETPFQELTNRSAWIKSALNGLILERPTLYSDSAGAATDVYVGPIGRLVLGSRILSSAALEVPTPGGGLAAETWYYVYGYDSSGVLAVEASTTAPESTLTFKTADTTRRYLGCFRTTTGSAVLPFRAVNGRYLYRASGDPGSELQALLATGTVGATDLILAYGGTATKELIPPHARLARLSSSLSATGGEVTATFYTKGDSGTTIRQEHADGIQAGMEFDIETDSSRTIRYTLTIGSAGSLQVRVIGFEE